VAVELEHAAGHTAARRMQEAREEVNRELAEQKKKRVILVFLIFLIFLSTVRNCFAKRFMKTAPSP
jgi:hypothetical protein